MRILYSYGRMSRDGAAIRREAMTTALLQGGHHVLPVGVPGPAPAEPAAPIPRRGVAGLLANLAARRRLLHMAASFRPDIVLAECDDLAPGAAWAASRLRVPLYLLVAAPFGAAGASVFLQRRAAHSAARVLATDDALRGVLLASGVACGRIAVVPGGVVAERFEPPHRADGSGPLTLGYIGFVQEFGGLDAVIRGMIAEDAPAGVRLTVIGDGAAREALEQLAATAGLFERVRFTGIVPPALVPALIGECDIGLLPQALAIGTPSKLFDYMAAGLAIVAPDRPNIRAWLRDGQTALLFDPGNSAAMWRAIGTFAADARLRQQFGEAARASLIAQRLTWRDCAARVAAMAQQDLESG